MTFHKNINKKNSLFKDFKSAKYKSTKHTNYFFIYEDLLKKYLDKKITFVEVGVANGGSLFQWKKYFNNNARIIGIDFNPDAKRLENFGFEIHIGNQSDNNFWKNFYKKIGKIDILVDDGGHTNEQQLSTFLNSYKHINQDGLMVFEDVHASYLPQFGNPSKYSFINFCKKLVDMQNQKSIFKKPSYDYMNKICQINFYQSIVAFHIDKEKAKKNRAITNRGKSMNFSDYRHQDTFIISTVDKYKYKLKQLLGKIFYNNFRKIYKPIKFLILKIKNTENKKFF